MQFIIGAGRQNVYVHMKLTLIAEANRIDSPRVPAFMKAVLQVSMYSDRSAASRRFHS